MTSGTRLNGPADGKIPPFFIIELRSCYVQLTQNEEACLPNAYGWNTLRETDPKIAVTLS